MEKTVQLMLQYFYKWHLSYQYFRSLKLVLKQVWIIPFSSKSDKQYSSLRGSFGELYELLLLQRMEICSSSDLIEIYKNTI